MDLTQSLRIDYSPLDKPSGSFVWAKNIIRHSPSSIRSDNVILKDLHTEPYDIVGIIEYDRGIIIFNANNEIVNLKELTDYNDESTVTLNRTVIIRDTVLNFSVTRPIDGLYYYNNLGELNIIWWEGVANNHNPIRILNVDNIGFDIDVDTKAFISSRNVTQLDLKINRPIIHNSDVSIVDGGSLLVGTYFYAIRSKFKNDYSDFTLLSNAIIVTKDKGKGLPINSNSNKSLNISFDLSNIFEFDTFESRGFIDMAIVHFNGTSYDCRLIENIQASDGVSIIVSDINKYPTISLDEILINTINYNKCESATLMSNKLILSNVSIPDYSNIDFSSHANSIKVVLANPLFNDDGSYDNNTITFMPNEVYAFYAQYRDNKGAIIGEYLIEGVEQKNAEHDSETVVKYTDYSVLPYYINPENNKRFHKMPNVRHKVVDSNGTMSSNLEPTQQPYYITTKVINLKFIVPPIANSGISINIMAAKRNYWERRVAASGLIFPQRWNGSNSGFYARQYGFLSFETQAFKPKLTFNKILPTGITTEILFTSEYKTVTSVFIYPWDRHPTPPPNFILEPFGTHNFYRHDNAEYIESNNLAQNNIFGNSFLKFMALVDNPGTENFRTVMTCFLLNTLSNYYTDYEDRELIHLGSGYINTVIDTTITIKGDAYFGKLALRLTKLTSISDKDLNQQTIVTTEEDVVQNLAIFESYSNIPILPVEGDMEVHKFFLTNGTLTSGEVFNIPVTFDNPINTATHKGYNEGYNKVCDFYKYIKPINVTYKYPLDIVRSDSYNADSGYTGFRYFRALSKLTLPVNRIKIVFIGSTDDTLYIQTINSLYIASIKDILNTDNGQTLLGSSDIFDRQPVEVFTSKYGVIGCKTKHNCNLTDMGYTVIDIDTSKIYLVNTENNELKPMAISDIDNSQFFSSYINRNFIPTNNNSQKCYFDKFNNNNRLLLLQSDYVISDINGVSFDGKSWVSLHNFIANQIIHTRRFQYWRLNGKIYLQTKKYFNYYEPIRYVTNQKESYIDILFNSQPDIKKLIRNVNFKIEHIYKQLIKASAREEQPILGTLQYDLAPKYIMIYTNHQSTGKIPVNVLSDWFNKNSGYNNLDTWYFNNIKDIIKDSKLGVFINNPDVINEDNHDFNKNWYDKSLLIDNYFIVRLYLNNTNPNIDQVLTSVGISATIDAR